MYQSLIRRLAVWLLAALLLGLPILAQENLPPANTPQSNLHPSVPLAKEFQKRLTHMTKRYRLTAEQRAQVHSILLKEQQDQHTISADRYMSGKDKDEERASLFEASQREVGALLTTQQKRKFDADEKRRAWMDGRLPEPNPGPALDGW